MAQPSAALKGVKLNDQGTWYEQDPNSTAGQYRVIPGAGVYLQEQNKAQSAWARSKAQLDATRAKRQITSGLGKDWSVDPRAQYGTYQQMLQQQGGELDNLNEGAQARGFFGAGLGNQGESALRYGHAVSALGFKNQLADWETEYANSLADINRQRQQEMLDALMASAGDAYENEDYNTADPTGGSDVQYAQAAGRNLMGPIGSGTVYGSSPRPKVRTQPRQFGSRGWIHTKGGRY